MSREVTLTVWKNRYGLFLTKAKADAALKPASAKRRRSARRR